MAKISKKECISEAKYNSNLAEQANWYGYRASTVWYGMMAVGWYEKAKYDEPCLAKVEAAFGVLYPDDRPKVIKPKDLATTKWYEGWYE